jgi:MOSC domain-containing protein YiiM
VPSNPLPHFDAATSLARLVPPELRTPGSGRQWALHLTLIEEEVLDDLTLPDGGKLGHAEARRNVVTRGLHVDVLVGRRFRVGDFERLGERLCEPCSHLEHLTTKGPLRGLIHRGGLSVDVLSDGDISPGAVIETIDQQRRSEQRALYPAESLIHHDDHSVFAPGFDKPSRPNGSQFCSLPSYTGRKPLVA